MNQNPGGTDSSANIPEMPAWIRRGRTFPIVALTVFCLFVVPMVLPWNEKLVVPVTIVSKSPPRSVIAPADGPIALMEAENGTQVRAGQALARLGQASSIEEEDRLIAMADAARSAVQKGRIPSSIPILLVDAQLQQPFSALAEAVAELNLYADYDSNPGQIRSLRQKLAALEQARLRADESTQLSANLVEVVRERLDAKSKAQKSGWVTKDAVAQQQQELIVRELDLRRYLDTEASIDSEINDLRAELSRVQIVDNGTAERRRKAVLQAAANAITAVEDQRRRYLLIAPVAGRVKFPQPRYIGQSITRGMEYAVIVPPKTDVSATATVSARSRSDVKKGAEVRLMFSNYPSARNGYVRGIVQAVSDVAVDGDYTISLELPSGLETSNGSTIPFRNRSAASGVIIVRQGHLFDVIVGALTSLFDS